MPDGHRTPNLPDVSAPVPDTTVDSRRPDRLPQVPAPMPQPDTRTRLLDRLDAALRRPVVLITAPTGSGKSTLLATWERHRAELGLPTARINLQAGDNEPHRLLERLAAALAPTQTGDCADRLTDLARPASYADNIDVCCQKLTEAIEAMDTPAVLILDGFHTIATSGRTYTALATLIAQTPERLQIVVSSHRVPHLPLARMRLAGSLSELTQRDLAMTRDEVSAVLANNGITLPDPLLDQLCEVTGGWAFGVRMAADIFTGFTPGTSADPLFTRLHADAVDFLVSEALEELATDEQDFLLRLSVLDEIESAAATALTGRPEAGKLLQRISGEYGLLLEELTENGRRYRAQPLLRKALQYEVEARIGAGGVRPLEITAAEWFASQGHTLQATRHLIAAQDYVHAENTLMDQALTLITTGYAEDVLEIIGSVPPAHRDTWPYAVMEAFALCIARPRESVRLLIEQAMAAADQSSGVEREYAQWWISLCKALSAYHAGRIAESRVAAQAVEDGITRTDLPFHATIDQRYAAVLPILGKTYVASSNGDGLREQLDLGFQAARRLHDERSRLTSDLMLALTVLGDDYGEFSTARVREMVEEIEALGLQHQFPLRYVYNVALAGALEEDNTADLARYYGAISSAEAPGSPVMSNANITMAYSIAVHGDLGQARAFLDGVQAELPGRESSGFVNGYLKRTAMRLALLDGDAGEARRQLAGFTTSADPETAVLRARAALLDGDAEAALATVPGTDGPAELRSTLRTEIALTRMCVFAALNRLPEAYESLRYALKVLRESARVIRFLEMRGQIKDLLLDYLMTQDAGNEQVMELLKQFAELDDTPHPKPLAGARPAAGSLPVPLTDRELGVLRLLPGTMSLSDIARREFISENTVKTHVKKVYTKLGAHTRREAVQRARDLGLL